MSGGGRGCVRGGCKRVRRVFQGHILKQATLKRCSRLPIQIQRGKGGLHGEWERGERKSRRAPCTPPAWLLLAPAVPLAGSEQRTLNPAWLLLPAASPCSQNSSSASLVSIKETYNPTWLRKKPSQHGAVARDLPSLRRDLR